MSVFGRYREVLRPAGATTALTASLVGRLALGMNGLALLILVRSTTGSYADAGLISASYAVFFAVGAPSRRAPRTGGGRAVCSSAAV